MHGITAAIDADFDVEKKSSAKYETKRKRKTRVDKEREKRIIAWDGEGIKLRPNKPQHYVLFGCSAEPHKPLKILTNRGDLRFEDLANYMCDVSDRYPNAKHVGYFFGYDQNMIIKSLPWSIKEALYTQGWIRYRTDDSEFRVNVKFGKQIFITRVRDGRTSSIRIDDIGPFFASSFVKAYESMFSDCATDPDWQTVVTGKLNRAETTWSDMRTVEDYWRVEIAALERLAVYFRDLMFKAGFPLSQWYGPGALASKIRTMCELGPHEWGGKEENIPFPVHRAAKYAFFGGHFEQYILGRINRPVYGLDIRSAYPYAFTQVPSLRNGGFWQEVSEPSAGDGIFGVYRVRYADPDASTKNANISRRGITSPQPLPWRDDRGNVIYSPIVEGWYWRPEVDMVRDLYPDRIEIYSGWEWRPADDSRPWADVLLPMFAKRRELKEAGDPCQLAFKLGPNSLYGKMAQRTGWNRATATPPRSHTLCIAGFITSYCRALVMRVIAQIPPQDLIAVETDGIYTAYPPEHLSLPNGIGPELGQWELEQYDEMVYVQNGLYLANIGGTWSKVKTRGIRRDQIGPDMMRDYLSSLIPGEHWKPLPLSAGERFTGLGAALNRARNTNGQIVPPKAAALHCRWYADIRDVVPGGRGKRSHGGRYCSACKNSQTPWDGEHPLVIASPTGIRFTPSGIFSDEVSVMSAPYQLPWEAEYKAPEWLAMDETTAHTFTSEDIRDLVVT